MSRVTTSEIQAWLEPTKLSITAPNLDLLEHMEEEVLVRISTAYDVSGWTDVSSTPKIVRTIISKLYASFFIDRAYSENQEENNDYAQKLKDNAEMLITGIVGGLIPIPDVPGGNGGNTTVDRAAFYPTDSSSAQKPTSDNPSLGGPYFSLGKSF